MQAQVLAPPGGPLQCRLCIEGLGVTPVEAETWGLLQGWWVGPGRLLDVVVVLGSLDVLDVDLVWWDLKVKVTALPGLGSTMLKLLSWNLVLRLMVRCILKMKWLTLFVVLSLSSFLLTSRWWSALLLCPRSLEKMTSMFGLPMTNALSRGMMSCPRDLRHRDTA